METRANYAVIGAFVIVATLAVAAFVLWLGQSQFQRDYKAYDIVFEGPVSLEDGSAVRYIGIKVGEVSTVRIDRADPSKVRARIRIDRETPVKTDSTASIQLAGITGVTFVQISAGSPTARLLEAKPGEPVPVIKAEKTQLDQLVAGGAQVLGQANDTMERVKKLLTDENVESISTSLKNIETITTKLAADDGLIDQATGTMKDLSRASNEFASASESVGTFSTNANQELAGLSGQLDDLLAEVQKVVASADAVIVQGKDTVGVVNTLLEGPATGVVEESRLAAQDLRILISRMDRLTRELEQNPQSMLVGEPVPYEDKR
ncbi:MlaD family protein [Hyphomonas jannaschiana]|uniref:Virulence factor Mce-like protein n=1 Tax=Hyphomonas jannaschiana VP2 TaxID=1280952 RepID=A0A059FKQ6_9PROT|nr:MlaD family protein [Hyphomonas jannaschiana]KCZ91023.1 virulence factor Mce-like protein [Hyphomonas jannaschiana VP2]